MMNRFLVTAAAAAAILACGSLLPGHANAVPLGVGKDAALDVLNPIEKVALCFYVDGWNGPGLYQCGYRRRVGEGFERREREERRERFDEGRERRDRVEDRRERRDRFEDRREQRDRGDDRRERRERSDDRR